MLHSHTALDGSHQVPRGIREAGDAARLVLEGGLDLLVHLLGRRQVEHLQGRIVSTAGKVFVG